MAGNAHLTVIVAEGSWGTVECVVLDSGDAPTKDFLEADETVAARFLVLFQNMANYGLVPPKRLKTEMDGLCAFRHEVGNRQIRFPCFQDGNRWIVTHGFVKPGAKNGKGKWPSSEVERAKNIRAEYWTRKKRLGNAAVREKQ